MRARRLRSSSVRAAVDRGELFVVAYFPLALILAFLAYPERWSRDEARWFTVWLAVAALGLYFMASILRAAHRVGGTQQAFTEVEDQGAEVTAYLASYLLPLVGVHPSGLNAYAAYTVYFVVLFVVFMRSERLALINPTLYLAGYQIFAARVVQDPSDGSPFVLCSRRTRRRIMFASVLCRWLGASW